MSTTADGTAAVEEELTPERTLQRTVVEGERRAKRPWIPMVATGLVGGIDVGLGVFALLLVEQATGSRLLGGLPSASGS